MKTEIKKVLNQKEITQFNQLNFNNKAEKHLITLHHILGRETAINKANFLKEYQKVLFQHNIPVLKLDTVGLLYKAWKHNNKICDHLVFFSKKVRVKIDSQDFWRFIVKKCFRIAPVKNEVPYILLIVSQLFTRKIVDKTTIEEFRFLFDKIMRMEFNSEELSLNQTDLTRNYEPLFVIFNIVKTEDSLSQSEKIDFLKRLKFKQYSAVRLEISDVSSFCEFIEALSRSVNIEFAIRYQHNQMKRLYEAYLVNPSVFKRSEINPDKYTTTNVEKYFFGNYMVPPVLINNFLLLNKQEKKWLYHDLKGRSLTKMPNSPVPLTRKAAHLFKTLDTIVGVSVKEFFLYASFISKEVSHEFAITTIRSIKNFKGSEFWVKTMTEFYFKELSIGDISNVMDYIYYVEFTIKRKVKWKHKSVRKLLLDSEKWHADVADGLISKSASWKSKYKRSSIPYYSIEWDDEQYRIVHLDTRFELAKEGRALRHCVATYHSFCKRGISQIYSLRRKLEDLTQKPLITIEIRDGKLAQALGSCNRKPTAKEIEIINFWMKENGLESRGLVAA